MSYLHPSERAPLTPYLTGWWKWIPAWKPGVGQVTYRLELAVPLLIHRVRGSLYLNNTLRNLRHFTFQWYAALLTVLTRADVERLCRSAMRNVAMLNDMDCDFNLHGASVSSMCSRTF
jgi:hypothetical protein